MTTYHNNSLNRGSRHRAEHGNLVGAELEVTILSGWAAGDIIALEEYPQEMVHRRMSIISDGCAGLTVNVGFFNLETHTDYPTKIASGVDLSAVGETALLAKPLHAVRDPDINARRVLRVVLNGTVTAGNKFQIVTDDRLP